MAGCAAAIPRWAARADGPHTWQLGKFPYQLVYAVREGEVFLLAYAHESRRPGYWTHRLNN